MKLTKENMELADFMVKAIIDAISPTLKEYVDSKIDELKTEIVDTSAVKQNITESARSYVKNNFNPFAPVESASFDAEEFKSSIQNIMGSDFQEDTPNQKINEDVTLESILQKSNNIMTGNINSSANPVDKLAIKDYSKFLENE